MNEERGLPFWTATDLGIGFAGDLAIVAVALLFIWLNNSVVHSDRLTSLILVAAMAAWLIWTSVLAVRHHRRYRAKHPLPRRQPGDHFR